MTDFAGLGLTPALVETLTRMDYTNPTPIQEKTIPLVLSGRDVLGTAQTGTGKTGAFAIPVIEFLLNSPRGSALIMTPTRELAAQVNVVVSQMLKGQGAVKTALLIGGEPMPKQLAQLRARPRVIIGTPGRINDHLERGSVMLHDAGMLVLDETDRMLDMGFGIQIDKILKFMPKNRQTLLFSATLPPEIVKISKKYLSDPARIEIGEASRPALNIDHQMVRATEEEKYPKLLQELDEREGSVIIFVKTKRGADRLASKLHRQGHRAEAIHGDLRQSRRDRVIKEFRNQRYRVMVATDVAARGLDIPHIEHVINFDLPQCAEDYIHRIGRTARAGAKGAALCYVSPADGGKWRAISRLLNPGEKVEGFENEGRGEHRRGRNSRSRRNDVSARRGNSRRQNKSFGERSARRDNDVSEARPRRERQERDMLETVKDRRPRRQEERSSFQRSDRKSSEWNDGSRPRRHHDEGQERRDRRQGGKRRWNDNKSPRQEQEHSSHPREERNGNRLEQGNENVPAFIERPFTEHPSHANEKGMFRKKQGGNPQRRNHGEYRDKPRREQREANGNRVEPNGNRQQRGRKHSALSRQDNVTRFDGPGSSYFRPSDSENRKPRVNSDEAENKPRGHKKNGKKRFGGGNKKPKFAA